VDSSAGKRDFAFGEFEPNAFWDNGTVRHVFLSHRGLPYEVIDESGWVLWRGEYDDWGRLLEVPPIADADPRLGLPGQQYDPESGLHYTRFRYYDAAETRFISPDPMGIVAGFNGFLYGPNAINWIDPLGLHCGRKAHSNSVYVLKRNGKIVYVGITKRDPAVRMREHARGNPSKGVKAKNFDEMVVVATGLTRRQARNIEGSALKNIAEAQAGTGPPIQNVAPSLDNAPRQGSNTYCHSYDSNTSGPGRQVFSPAQTNQQLNNPNGQSIPNP
jgi:RHS repeat-associated protein